MVIIVESALQLLGGSKNVDLENKNKNKNPCFHFSITDAPLRITEPLLRFSEQ